MIMDGKNFTSWEIDYSRLLDALQSRKTSTVWIESILWIVINILTIVGNGLTLKIIICDASQRTLVSNYLIASLAIADFGLGILSTPLLTGPLIYSKWPYNDTTCQCQGFITLALACASVLNLTLMALNRYFRVVKTAKYRTYFTARRTIGYIGVVWVLSMIGAASYIPTGHRFVFNPGKFFCYLNIEDDIFMALLVTFYIAIPALITAFCYYKVHKVIKDHKNSMANSGLGAKEINVTRILFIVVVMFMLSWLPIFVMDIIDVLRLRWSLPREAYVAYSFFAASSTAINSILYGIMNPTFRKEYLKTLGCRRCQRFRERVVVPSNHTINASSSLTLENTRIEEATNDIDILTLTKKETVRNKTLGFKELAAR